jgi:hypothetical protein
MRIRGGFLKFRRVKFSVIDPRGMFEGNVDNALQSKGCNKQLPG